MTWFQKPPLGTPLDWENPLNKGTVLALAMNEGHGDKVQDLSMKRNHGTLNGFAFPPTVASGWNPGRAGVGLNFDGSNDYVDCGNDASLNVTDAITLSVWINGSLYAGSTRRIIHKNKSYALYYTPTEDGRVGLVFYVWNGTFICTNTTPNTNTWYNVIATYNSNAAGNNMKIYVNGILIVEGVDVGDIPIFAEHVYIGIDENLVSFLFNGSISDVRIHNRALSAKEAKDYYINPYSVYLDEDD